MYIQNRRNGSKFKVCSPLQLLNGLIGLKPAIAYFAYTYRWLPLLNSSNRAEYKILSGKYILTINN